MPKTILVPPVPNRELMAAAYTAYRGNCGKIILLMVIYAVIQGGIAIINGQLPWLAGITWALQLALNVGFIRFFLEIVRGQTPSFGAIGHALPLRRLGTTVAATLLVILRILLWSLLLIIPGIVAIFNYLLVYYILAEDRQCTAREAIRRSCILMYGHRWQYFRLVLRLLGLLLIIGVAAGVTCAFPWAGCLLWPNSPIVPLLAGIVMCILLLGWVLLFGFGWVPFCYLSIAAFYNSVLPDRMPELTPEPHPELQPVTETSPIIGAEPIVTALPPEPSETEAAPDATAAAPEYAGMPVWQTVLLLLLVLCLGLPGAFVGRYSGSECSNQIRFAAKLRQEEKTVPTPAPAQFSFLRLLGQPVCPNGSGARAQYFDATPYFTYSKDRREQSRQPVLIELPGNHWGLLFHVATADGRVHDEWATEPGLEAYLTLLTAQYETSPALLKALTEHYNQASCK